jgi:hypothetical protein
MAKAASNVQEQVTNTTNTRKVSSAGAKVTVYCKYPSGIKLHVDKMVASHELVMGGGSREVKVAQKVPGMDYVIRGPATEINKRSRVEIVGGYAVNRGVPKDIWDGWLEANKDTPMVRNELIFARPGDHGDDHGQARDNKKLLSGFEPLKPDNDPRKPRPSKSENVGDIEAEDGDHPGME